VRVFCACFHIIIVPLVCKKKKKKKTATTHQVAQFLDRRIEELGGVRLVPQAEGDERSSGECLTGVVDGWTTQVADKLRTALSLGNTSSLGNAPLEKEKLSSPSSPPLLPLPSPLSVLSSQPAPRQAAATTTTTTAAAAAPAASAAAASPPPKAGQNDNGNSSNAIKEKELDEDVREGACGSALSSQPDNGNAPAFYVSLAVAAVAVGGLVFLRQRSKRA
jgi:hypothetical protein